MGCKIVSDIKDLPNFSGINQLIIDTETTSFDDKVKAFYPFKGHRICGVAISTVEKKREDREVFFFPLRLRTKKDNLPLEPFFNWFKETISSKPIDIIGQNFKFDARFFWQDKIWFEGKILELLTTARLAWTDLPSFSLEDLAKTKLDAGIANDNLKKSAIVKAYLRSVKSVDYGALPLNIIAPYAMQDVILTGDLWHKTLEEIPEESKALFEVETGLLKHLLIAEINGMQLNAKLLKQKQMQCLRELLTINEKINKLIGFEIEPSRDIDQNNVFLGHLNLNPVSYTEKGSPQWNAVNLRTYNLEVCNLWADYLEKHTFFSTFLEGWSERIDSNGIIHASLNPYGAVTGRMSSSDPNIQNIPEESECFIITPNEDYCIVYFDYSQAEYRMFGHYTGEPNIIEIYLKNPRADFHQALADKLGLPRRPTKNINFGMLYGIGIGKLVKMISNEFIANKDDEKTKKKLLELHGKDEALTQIEYEEVATKVLREYHYELPSIKRLTKRIRDKVQYDKRIKSIYGRIFRFEDPNLAYKGLNWLIQGSTSDMVKKAIKEFLDKYGVKRPGEFGIRLFNTVHDSGWFYVPKTMRDETIKNIREAFEVKNLKVPIIIDIEISDTSMAELKPYEAAC